MTAILHKGCCRCGTVSIETRFTPEFSVYCHCDDCRRATGAPVLASIGIPKDEIDWTSDRTLARHKVGTATRLFCNQCGSPVAQEHESRSDMTFFNTCFMDQPEEFPPTAHTFEAHQLEWLKLSDELPRFEKTILIETN